MSLTRSQEQNQNDLIKAQQEYELFGGGATQAIEEGPLAWEDDNTPPSLLKTQSLFSPQISTDKQPTTNLRRSR